MPFPFSSSNNNIAPPIPTTASMLYPHSPHNGGNPLPHGHHHHHFHSTSGLPPASPLPLQSSCPPTIGTPDLRIGTTKRLSGNACKNSATTNPPLSSPIKSSNLPLQVNVLGELDSLWHTCCFRGGSRGGKSPGTPPFYRIPSNYGSTSATIRLSNNY